MPLAMRTSERIRKRLSPRARDSAGWHENRGDGRLILSRFCQMYKVRKDEAPGGGTSYKLLAGLKTFRHHHEKAVDRSTLFFGYWPDVRRRRACARRRFAMVTATRQVRPARLDDLAASAG